MQDLNQLTAEQLNQIRKVSKHKTLEEWRNPDNEETIKIKLLKNQKQHVIATKNYITYNKSEFDLLMENIISFTEHAIKRAVWRIENRKPDMDIKIETQLKIIKACLKTHKTYKITQSGKVILI